MPATYKLTHHAACGMPIYLVDKYARAELDEVRQRAAKRLRYLRREGYPINTLEKGKRWEIGAPEDCVLIPDACGILALSAIPLRMVTCYSCDEEMPEDESDMHECWTPNEETERDTEEE